MAFEGMNNAGASDSRLIVILNDNTSIAACRRDEQLSLEVDYLRTLPFVRDLMREVANGSRPRSSARRDAPAKRRAT